jgi:choline dehydrogenase-like flavoprotein
MGTVERIYIIGSGLSAMAAAEALVRRGCRPVILDAGLLPDPEALKLKMKLAESEPEEWKSRDLNLARQIGPVATNGIPRKLFFGSDFSFREIDHAPGLQVSQASIHRSFAAGGFSNVWGAVYQSLPPGEMKLWPVTFEELTPHYDAVRKLLCDSPNFSGAELAGDGFNPAAELRPSSQAKSLYSDLQLKKRELDRAGVSFGYAQLAIRSEDIEGSRGCCYCGLCLHGCPYDCKYSAGRTLERLIRKNVVEYIPGVAVNKLARDNGSVRIEARSLYDGAPRVFRAGRVLLAAGLLETSRTILDSLCAYDTPFQIKHSDIFTLPVIRYHAEAGIARERMHTLCQLVAQINDAAISPYSIHLQFYGYNDLYPALLKQKSGLLAYPLMPMLNTLASRLFVIFGYIHSSASSTFSLTLANSQRPTLQLTGQPSALALKICRAVARKLFEMRKCFQAVPLKFQLRMDLPGGGYHSGGIFPMRNRPGPFETDRLGRLAALPNVHIIDTSILPEIPSYPPAFTAMANAHRIASEIEVPHDR